MVFAPSTGLHSGQLSLRATTNLQDIRPSRSGDIGSATCEVNISVCGDEDAGPRPNVWTVVIAKGLFECITRVHAKRGPSHHGTDISGARQTKCGRQCPLVLKLARRASLRKENSSRALARLPEMPTVLTAIQQRKRTTWEVCTPDISQYRGDTKMSGQ